MKRVVSIFMVLALCIVFFSPGSAEAARRRKHIVAYFDEQKVIKAHVSEISNSSGDNNINGADLKKSIEEALELRMSHTFEIVSQDSDAGIVINVDVIEYIWQAEDPVDVLFPPVATAVDVAKTENYARMGMVVVVKDAGSGKEMWKDTARSTITKEIMPQDESYDLSYERIAKDFIKKLFKKDRKRM